MRAAIQMIRSALGDAEFNDCTLDPAYSVGRFEFYRVNLSRPKYIGIPTEWYFGVLTEPERSSTRQQADQALSHAGDLVRNSLAHGLKPLVLLSDDPTVKLSSNLRFEGKNVFFIDHDRLPAVSRTTGQLRSAPFLRAVQQKVSRKDLPSLFFEPYTPTSPAMGWKFFGRRQELQRIVNTPQSFVVVGARRIGKTSLLREAKRRLELDGVKVHFVGVQDLMNAQQVVQAILNTLSVRESEAALRRQKALNESLLQAVLRSISRQQGRVTLILDELGNVIAKSRQDDWRIMGAFREYMHSGSLQVIVSGFQEFFLKQFEDAAGPFVNLAEVMRLNVFDDDEIDEFLIEPLALWANIADRRKFREMVTTRVGRQPLMLQHFGRALFHKSFDQHIHDLDAAALELINRNAAETFDSVVEELFFRVSKPPQRYIFLKACTQAEKSGQSLAQFELSDAWVKETLLLASCESTFDSRRLLLESLEMVGLTGSIGHNRSRQTILAPIVWEVIKGSEPDIEGLIETFASELRDETMTSRRRSQD
jgi:hypothetical protein